MEKGDTRVAALLREELHARQSEYLIKLDSERVLSQRFGVGRQRMRGIIAQLVSEGLLVKQEGKATYIMPRVKSRYLNLLCSPGIKRNDPFYNGMLVELTNFAAKESVNIIPLDLSSITQGMRSAPTLLVGRFEEGDLELLKERYPVLIAFENYQDQDGLNQIYYNHYKIGFNAVRTLCEYGHRRLIHLTGSKLYASSNQRRDGFLNGVKKYGAEYTIVSEKMNFSGGYKTGPVVEKLARERGYTAAFVANDWMAVGLIQYLKEHDLAVPDEFSVIGVDNISLSGQVSPSLTTFSLDTRLMVAEAFVLMNGLFSAPDSVAIGKKVILEPYLVVRESLKRIK